MPFSFLIMHDIDIQYRVMYKNGYHLLEQTYFS